MDNKKQLIFAFVITIIYALLTLNTVLHHELWADEAQVWLLCKNLSIPELYNHLKNEGHPILFYLMVMPFAKMFSNIIYMKLICWFFMTIAIFLLTYFSPFKIYATLAIVFSAGFLYFFPVIARNYSIIPFLVFLAAILHNKQKEHPILYATTLACIANTHIIMLFFAFCLAFRFYYLNFLLNIRNKTYKEIKNYILPLIIMALGFILVVFTLGNTTGSNVFLDIKTNNIIYSINRVFISFFVNAFNYDIGVLKSLINPIVDLSSLLFMGIIYITLFINLYANSKKLFWIAFLSIGFQFCIYIFAYNSYVYVNRIFCAHIILIFCYWILLAEDNFKSKLKIFGKTGTNILLTIFLAFTIYNGVNYSIKDLKYEYSGSRKTAEFIRENLNPDNSLILTDNEPYMLALVYYLQDSHKIYSAFRKKNLEYVIWDTTVKANYASLGWVGYSKYYKQTDSRDFYVIIPTYDKKHQLEKAAPNDFKLIYESEKSIEPNEGHRIYKFIGEY